MKFSQQRLNQAMIVGLSGRMDVTNAAQAEVELLGHVEEGEKLMVLDCAELDYISSAGLRVLLLTAKKMQANRGEVRLSSLQAPIREVFDIAGFSQVFAIYPDTDSALSASA